MIVMNTLIRPSYRPGLPSLTPTKQPSQWAISDIPSDIIIEVGGVVFSLHKVPLISRCGLLKMLTEDATQNTITRIELESVPGGPEGFELAAKFCYGVHLEISKYNVALLRCIGEFLDMSEEYEQNNLISQTESYLERLGKQTFKDIVTVLSSCQSLSPMAEDLNILSKCIELVTKKAFEGPDNGNILICNRHSFDDLQQDLSTNVEWWVEDLSNLHIDLFHRVMIAMKDKGLTSEAMAGALIFYGHKSLNGLTKNGLGHWNKLSRHPQESTTANHEQRLVVETIVSLLPREKSLISINFLIGLLRNAYMLDATLACRIDLEKRISRLLHLATLDDLLIPSTGAYEGETLFDVDIVHRLVNAFVQMQGQKDFHPDNGSDQLFDENLGFGSPARTPIAKVSKLVDGFLGEVSADPNLSLSKFISLADLIPDYARPVEDGLYRAIDIFLKSHPIMTDVEKKKLCRLLDFQKLSQEACSHAAQNERLPVQAVVQVLYIEQMRIRNVMTGTHHPNVVDTAMNGAGGGVFSDGSFGGSSPTDHYASVRRENRELKMEVARMRMRLNDLEKDHLYMKHDMEKVHHPHPQHHHQDNKNNHHSDHHHGFFHALTKSINKLNPFQHHKLTPAPPTDGQFDHDTSPPSTYTRMKTHSLPSVSSQASSFTEGVKVKEPPRRRRHSSSRT